MSHHVTDLFIKNFRNISEVHLHFGPGHHVFLGENGQGKTNCLEAIALLCSLRPMQPLQNIDLIKFNEGEANLSGQLGERHVAIDVLSEGKRARLNNKHLKNVSQLTSQISLVTFIPAELSMISGGASLRRRALDQAAASLFFEHSMSLRAYEKLLSHRNRLLKMWPIDLDTLRVFTEVLLKEAAQIISYRLQAIDAIHKFFVEHAQTILGPDHEPLLQYVLKNNETIDKKDLDSLLDMMKEAHCRVKDIELKRRITLFGPHLDDVSFLVNGINTKKSASRGQGRALVLAFKLAQMLAIERLRGHSPIIILDDILSELDDRKSANLLNVVRSLNTQAFFAGTNADAYRKHTQFFVRNGLVSPGE